MRVYFDTSVVLRVVLVRMRFPAIRFATHDIELGAAAAAEGLPVIGA
jgi:hypothetical protein